MENSKVKFDKNPAKEVGFFVIYEPFDTRFLMQKSFI
jgi:hypothetical protein